jgi:hypothetical protein
MSSYQLSTGTYYAPLMVNREGLIRLPRLGRNDRSPCARSHVCDKPCHQVLGRLEHRLVARTLAPPSADKLRGWRPRSPDPCWAGS